MITQLCNRPSFCIAFLILIVFVFYGHTFDYGFIYDDYIHQAMLTQIEDGQREANIYNFVDSTEEVEQFIQLTALPWWTDPSWRMKYFRPLSTMMLMLDYSLWGKNPIFYHAVNVVWYTVLVILVFVFYNTVCANVAMALCGAVVFAIEPCHYLTVLWSANRPDLICAVFMVGGFICYIYSSRYNKTLFTILFIISYLSSLFAKEVAFVLPLLILVYDWIRHKEFRNAVHQNWKIYLLLCSINVVFFLFYITSGYGHPLYGESFFSNYLFEFSKATSLYCVSLFYGIVIAGLNPNLLSTYWFVVIVPLLCLSYILCIIWKQRKRFPEIGLFMLWIFILMPFIIVPPINDRVLLIPSIGYAYLAALVIFKLQRKKLAIFFIITGLLLPVSTNIIQAKEFGVMLKSNYEQLFKALDEIVAPKTSRDRLFFLNFPRSAVSGETWMYLDLFFVLYHHYPQWEVPAYILSPFGDAVSVALLDNHRIRISHPTQFYFQSNLEKLFSLSRAFSEGETFQMSDIKINIEEMEREKVKSILIEFVEPLDTPHYYLLFFNQGRWQRWFPGERAHPFKH